MSDASRKRRSREARRAEHIGGSPSAAIHAGESRAVTEGHERSQVVTLNPPSLLSELSELSPPLATLEGGAATPLPPPAPPVEARVRSSSKRGSRLPADWQPKPETVEAFRAQGIDALAAVPEFVDHWIAAAGEKGCKLDWEATFRNQIRRLTEWGRAPKVAGNGATVALQRGVKLVQGFHEPHAGESTDEKKQRLAASVSTGVEVLSVENW